jgi:hypothetical protein
MEAKRFLAEIDTGLSRGSYFDPHAGRLLFATHARQWLDSRNDELTTKARDASIMDTHVLPRWGDWQLSKIDHLSVQKWITELGTDRAPATVAEAHRLTSAVLRSAVRNRLIAFNPCEGIRLPRRRRGDTADKVISREDLRSEPWAQPVVAFDLEGSVGQDSRRARDVDVSGSGGNLSWSGRGLAVQGHSVSGRA